MTVCSHVAKVPRKEKERVEKSTRTSLSNSFDFFFPSPYSSAEEGNAWEPSIKLFSALLKKTGGNNRMHATAAGGGGKQTPTKKPDDALARLRV